MEPEQSPLPDLLTCCGDELRGHILQHHRLQGEAADPLSPLDERAPAQPIHGFQHLSTRQRGHQHREQIIQGHRLAQDGQPGEHRLLLGGEPRPLLVEQLGDAAKDGRAPSEELVNRPTKEVSDGLGHDVQGQGVARVDLPQAGLLLGGAGDLVLGQQLLAGRGLQPGEAQGAHERAAALQGAQGGGLLPAGQQQATLVRRLGYLPQQMLVRFKARTQMPPHLAFFQ